MVLLFQGVHPAVLIAADQARIESPSGHVLQDGDCLCHPYWLAGRQHRTEQGALEALGACGQVRRQQPRRCGRSIAFAMGVTRRGGKDGAPGLFRQHHAPASCLQHLLRAFLLRPRSRSRVRSAAVSGTMGSTSLRQGTLALLLPPPPMAAGSLGQGRHARARAWPGQAEATRWHASGRLLRGSARSIFAPYPGQAWM